MDRKIHRFMEKMEVVLISSLLICSTCYGAKLINLAKLPGAVATQSGDFTYLGRTHVAQLAIDGIHNQAWNSLSCAHTQVGKPEAWWQVDLRNIYNIHRVVLYYRNDTTTQKTRLAGYKLYISNASYPSMGRLCKEGNQFPDFIQDAVCDMTGRYVLFYTKKQNAIFEMCEVDVFGCHQGKYGNNCESRCSKHCVNPYHCELYNGRCECSAGYKGPLCDSVCPSRFFGKLCMQQCHCHHEGCDHITGKCNYQGCLPGWRGLSCDIGCVAPNFGRNCEQQCHCLHKECDSVNGKCLSSGCKTGWRGSSCDQHCFNGTFGENCQETCHCLSIVNCDHVTGRCPNGQCKAGWNGTACNINCQPPWFGSNCRQECHCLNGTGCNAVDGTCDIGLCQPGWRGLSCNQRCVAPNFGRNCEQQCHCQNGGCNHVNGRCSSPECQSGWSGPSCDHHCPHGTFGQNCHGTCRCFNNVNCDHVTGRCPDDQCEAGWNGTACILNCQPPWFGSNCRQECHCLNGTGCDPTNGTCDIGLCQPGWRGLSCNQKCHPGNYGDGCAYTCFGCIGNVCDPRNGECEKEGCITGFTGLRCQFQDASLNALATSNTLGGAIGGIVGLLIAFLIGILFAYILRKRHYRENKDGKQSNQVAVNPKRGTREEYAVVQEHSNVVVSTNNVNQPNVEYAVVNNRLDIHLNGSVDLPRSDTGISRAECSNIIKSLGHAQQGHSSGSIAMGDVDDKRSANGFVADKTIEEDNVYWNDYSIETMTTNGIAITDLAAVIDRKKIKDEFKTEFETLSKGAVLSSSEGQKEENTKKNRYLTTFPYDHSRVTIQRCKDFPSDYINASYIKNYRNDKAYIATQGPKKNTFPEFWKMIWQEGVEKIVMVTKLVEGDKRKCDQYWPSTKTRPFVAGPFSITLSSEKIFSLYTYRSMTISFKETMRNVHHFHFTKWPDHGVPETVNFVKFYRKVKDVKANGPLAVHCSAGIGRTGCFLALDALHDYGQDTGYVDVLGYINMMRTGRMNMIQTLGQYITVHEALVEAFTVDRPAILVSDFTRVYETRLKSNRDNSIRGEFRQLQSLKLPFSADNFKAASSPENLDKNVSRNILPHDDYRPFLMTYGRQSNDYINAIIIPTFREEVKYFVTQIPLKKTIGDFWSLIYDNHCNVVAVLDSASVSNNFIPTKEGENVTYDNFTVERKSSSNSQIIVTVEHQGRDDNRRVTLVLYGDWRKDKETPNSVSSMAEFLQTVKQVDGSELGILVVCRDGCQRSGLFLTLCLALQQSEHENEINIFQIVRSIQSRRPDFIPSFEQYKFVYEVIRKYMCSSVLYVNT